MPSGKYKLSGPASREIDELWDYIYAKSASLSVADQVIRRIYESFDLLGENPLAGHTREDLTEQDLRFWSVYSYLIVYRPGVEPIEILAIIHGAREISVLLAKEEARFEHNPTDPE